MSQEEKMLEELQKIRELLTPPPPPPALEYKKGDKGILAEFKDFLQKFKVLGLAVAFIMGVYLGNLVQSLVNALILPLIGLLIPGLDNLSTLGVPVTLFDPEKPQIFAIGPFLSSIITFIIVAFVIFLIVKLSKRWGIE
ncbi:MAG: putative large-conductance mechanosensitive channel [Promethearchaeota archaeon CR_4]|nr:MAG: putative large-conductance mechanosensitive channel [Candidatus Lokiarchaeota archaeon CR_4]